MTTYNTGNPVPSSDAKDFFDNAENLDSAINGDSGEWIDRLGESRKTWASIEQTAEGILLSGGNTYESEAAGRAAVGDGEYYFAESQLPGVTRTLWQRVSETESRFVGDDPELGRTVINDYETGGTIYQVVTTGGEVLAQFDASKNDGKGLWEYPHTKAMTAEADTLKTGDVELEDGGPLGVLSLENELGEVALSLGNDGTLSAPKLESAGRTKAGSFATGDVELSDGGEVRALSLENELGEIALSLSNDGTLNIAKLNVSGEAYAGGEIVSPVPQADYAPGLISQATVDYINSQPVTQGDGSAITPDHEPPILSIDTAAYGYFYAQLGTSIQWVGSRLWIAVTGQNTRDGELSEGVDGFVRLRYSDDPYSTDPNWVDVCYFIPAYPGLRGGQVIDPKLVLMPDGRLMVIYPTPMDAYACIIENPAATRGTFTIGRRFWIGKGIPMFPAVVDGRILMPIDRWDLGETSIRELIPVEFDVVNAVDYADLPLLPEGRAGFSEPILVPMSGGRFSVMRRTKGVYMKNVSEPTGRVWTEQPYDWTEYDSTSARGAGAISPSGRTVLVWNNSPGRRSGLTIGLSEDDGATYPWIYKIQDSNVPAGQDAEYPSLAFIEINGDVKITVSYDFGRKSGESGRTRIARVSEDAIRNQNVGPGDYELIETSFVIYASEAP